MISKSLTCLPGGEPTCAFQKPAAWDPPGTVLEGGILSPSTPGFPYSLGKKCETKLKQQQNLQYFPKAVDMPAALAWDPC